MRCQRLDDGSLHAGKQRPSGLPVQRTQGEADDERKLERCDNRSVPAIACPQLARAINSSTAAQIAAVASVHQAAPSIPNPSSSTAA